MNNNNNNNNKKMLTQAELSMAITPKSGPVRRMVTVHDAVQALLFDLPYPGAKPPHWVEAGLLVVRAAETLAETDIARATDALVKALEREGWMSRMGDGSVAGASGDKPADQDEIARRIEAALRF
jgi:hypothetical protein